MEPSTFLSPNLDLIHENPQDDYVSDDESLLDEMPPSVQVTLDLDKQMTFLMGRHTEGSVNTLTSGIKTIPDQAKWYFSRGMAYQGLKKYQHAIEDFTCTINLIPTNEPSDLGYFAYINRARVRYNMGDFKGADEDARLAYKCADNPEGRRECEIEQARIKVKLAALEDDSDRSEVTHYGSDRVITDLTNFEAKLEARKAAKTVEESIAAGRKLAEKGLLYRKKTEKDIESFKLKVDAENKARKERNARRANRREATAKKKLELLAIAAEKVATTEAALKKKATAATLIILEEDAHKQEGAREPIAATTLIVETAENDESSKKHHAISEEISKENGQQEKKEEDSTRSELVSSVPSTPPIYIERIPIPIRVIRRPAKTAASTSMTNVKSSPTKSSSTTSATTTSAGSTPQIVDHSGGKAEEEDLLTHKGIQLLSAKRYKEAIAAFTLAINADRSFPHPLCYIKRATAYIGDGQVEAALKDCEAAAALMQPEVDWVGLWYELYVLRSKIFKGQGDAVSALQELEKAEALDISVSQRYKVAEKIAELVELHAKEEERKRMTAAAAASKEAAKAPASTGKMTLGSGKAKATPATTVKKLLIEEIKEEEPKKSDKVHEKSTPSVAAATSSSSTPLQGAQKVEDKGIKASINEDVDALKDFLEIHLSCGEQAIRDKNWALAEPEYNLVIQLNPQCTEAYVQLALVYAEQGKWPLSESFATKALEIDSRSREARNYRANAYFKQKKHLEAFNEYLFLAEEFEDTYAADRALKLQNAMKLVSETPPEVPQQLKKDSKIASGKGKNAVPAVTIGKSGTAQKGSTAKGGKASALKTQGNTPLPGFQQFGDSEDLMVSEDIFRLLSNLNIGAIDPRSL